MKNLISRLVVVGVAVLPGCTFTYTPPMNAPAQTQHLESEQDAASAIVKPSQSPGVSKHKTPPVKKHPAYKKSTHVARTTYRAHLPESKKPVRCDEFISPDVAPVPQISPDELEHYRATHDIIGMQNLLAKQIIALSKHDDAVQSSWLKAASDYNKRCHDQHGKSKFTKKH